MRHTTLGENMVKGAALVNTLIENSDRVRSYDFSHLNRCSEQFTDANAPKKLNGSKMTTKVKQSNEKRVNYTFAL